MATGLVHTTARFEASLLDARMWKVFQTGAKKVTDEQAMVFKQEDTTSHEIRQYIVTDLPMAERTDKSENAPISAMRETYPRTTPVYKYTQGTVVEEEIMEDALPRRDNILSRMGTSMGKAQMRTRQYVAFSMLDNAFDATYDGADGVALCSATHPLDKGDAGTYSNIATGAGAMSYTRLQAMKIDLEGQVGDKGEVLAYMPQKLVYPFELQFIVDELLKSPDRPDTDNRAINVLKMKVSDMTPVSVHYITSATAFFMLSDEHSLTVWERIAIEIARSQVRENGDHYWRSRQRIAADWLDPRGLVGVTGT